jgi:hypothetical protein
MGLDKISYLKYKKIPIYNLTFSNMIYFINQAKIFIHIFL